MLAVLDDFLADPASVRNSALASGFGSWRPNKGQLGAAAYAGMNFYGDHADIIETIYKKVGMIGYPNSVLFRVTNTDTERAVVHSDVGAGDTTVIVYLSSHPDKYGTGFYRNKRTGSLTMPPLAELAKYPAEFEALKREITESTADQWDEVAFVAGQYNRAVIFSSHRFHRRCPDNGFGTDEHTGRLIWIGHFRNGKLNI